MQAIGFDFDRNRFVVQHADAPSIQCSVDSTRKMTMPANPQSISNRVIVISQHSEDAARGRKIGDYLGRRFGMAKALVNEIARQDDQVGVESPDCRCDFSQIGFRHLTTAMEVRNLDDAKAIKGRSEVGNWQGDRIDFDPSWLYPARILDPGPISAEPF